MPSQPDPFASGFDGDGERGHGVALGGSASVAERAAFDVLGDGDNRAAGRRRNLRSGHGVTGIAQKFAAGAAIADRTVDQEHPLAGGREQETVALSHQLKAEGYDVFVGGVDAYSTLGWFHDPVLNTFIHYSDIDLAETIFHELTHRRVFRWGDTVFNESLANTVAEEGVKRWLKYQGRRADLKNYQGRLVRRREFYQEIDRARWRLAALYASGQSAPVMREKKAAILVKLRDQFRELRRRWGGHGLESWLHEDINNGHIVSLNLYAEKMPVFEKLLAECGGDLDLFFQQAAKLKLPKP